MPFESIPALPDRVALKPTRASGERAESVQSLERGLSVLEVFSSEHPALTLSEVARLAGLSRATARRILHTLRHLGHVRSEDRRFSLTPRVLSLGWAYLSSLSLWDLAMPYLEDLVAESGESCAASTLALPDIVCVARASSGRIMDPRLAVGARLPVHATSAGRVLLADLPEPEFDRFLAAARLESLTPRTITDPQRLREAVRQARTRSWALVDQELEMGLRSIAVPIQRPGGRTLAALNLSSAAGRFGLEELRTRFLPSLQRTAAIMTTALERLPHSAVSRRPDADA